MTARLVVLAYNEEAGIRTHLESVQRLGRTDLSVIVVDDGSRDGTAAAAQAMAGAVKVEVVSHPRNLGIAAAFNTGLRHAVSLSGPGDLVITMEGDGTSDVDALPPMIQLLEEGHDVVCASRYRRGGRYEGFPAGRRFFSVAANLTMRWYCRIPGVRDYTIFYRGYRAEILREAMHRYGDRFIEADGFFANIEILLKLSRLGPLRAAETPMVYRYGRKRSRSTMRVWRNVAEYARFIARDVRDPRRPSR
jgi:dolichol-phosphate mannosyltransferase